MIRIMKYGDVPNSEIFARTEPKVDVEAIVTDIIRDVRERGDAALYDYAARFDRVDTSAGSFSLEVTEEEFEEAFRTIEAEDPQLIGSLEKAAANIAAYHRKQLRTGFEIRQEEGIVLGQRVLPIARAGLYVPGGKAAYPSTVLMDTIPALIAGSSQVSIVTPPAADGTINPVIATAAKVAEKAVGGARVRIFKTGGAQAVAALAYGTETVPAVDKIVGPGNAFVAEAKRQVFGQVAIDMIAGPSEILVVADGRSNPAYVAADLLSQAEHDEMASAVLVTDSAQLAEAVSAEIEKQLASLEREPIARASIDDNGKIIVAGDISQAIDIANEIAPEHIEICVDQPFEYLDRIKYAGSIFLGRSCPEALGDYLAGTNHTLPTGGSARFSSPLSVDDFIKTDQYIYYTADRLAEVAGDIDRLARKEGLTGHARSATIRVK